MYALQKRLSSIVSFDEGVVLFVERTEWVGVDGENTSIAKVNYPAPISLRPRSIVRRHLTSHEDDADAPTSYEMY